jgi:hypothetical protein
VWAETENVWAVLKGDVLEREWSELGQDRIDCLILSIPSRVKACTDQDEHQIDQVPGDLSCPCLTPSSLE